MSLRSYCRKATDSVSPARIRRSKATTPCGATQTGCSLTSNGWQFIPSPVDWRVHDLRVDLRRERGHHRDLRVARRRDPLARRLRPTTSRDSGRDRSAAIRKRPPCWRVRVCDRGPGRSHDSSASHLGWTPALSSTVLPRPKGQSHLSPGDCRPLGRWVSTRLCNGRFLGSGNRQRCERAR